MLKKVDIAGPLPPSPNTLYGRFGNWKHPNITKFYFLKPYVLGMVDITRKVPRMGNMPYAVAMKVANHRIRTLFQNPMFTEFSDDYRRRRLRPVNIRSVRV